LTARFTAFMSKKDEGEQLEWCGEEKKKYLQYMRDHMPVQYENLMRVEENNF
jgi:hypothetical protein